MVTDVVNIDIHGGVVSHHLYKLGNPIELTMQMAKPKKTELIDGNCTVPLDKKKWTPEYLDDNVTIHRVDVFKGAIVIIDVVTPSPLKVSKQKKCILFCFYF